jgi:hypothetical protein
LPYISNYSVLLKLVNTLDNPKTNNNYKELITGIAIHIQNEDQPFPVAVFSPLKHLSLKVISLQYISEFASSNHCEIALQEFMRAQLDQGATKIYLYNCSASIVNLIFRSIQENTRYNLTTLSINECDSITDNRIAGLVKYCPNLKSLHLIKSGYFSDVATIAVADHCRQLDSLVITLPSNIIQSNTITMDTINALKKNCHKPIKFYCPGQTRISEYLLACKNNLFNDE